MVTLPTPACPTVAVQTTKKESHLPPQMDPDGETVAMLGLLLVKVMSATMVAPDRVLCDSRDRGHIPLIQRNGSGETTIVAGTGFVVALPPPQAARRERQTAARSALRTRTTENCMHPPRRIEMPADYKSRNNFLRKALSVEAVHGFGKPPGFGSLVSAAGSTDLLRDDLSNPLNLMELCLSGVVGHVT